MQSIITYKPSRDLLGRFKTSRRTKAKLLFVLLALTSFWLNYWQSNQWLVLRCKLYNGTVKTGYFTQAECHDLFEANRLQVQYNTTEEYIAQHEQEMLTNNPDL
jgi:hypothetical protein